MNNSTEIKKYFTREDKWRTKMFEKLEDLINEDKITDEEFEEYRDRVNSRDYSLTDELNEI